MARKKKRQDAQNFPGAAGGFVPASLDNNHAPHQGAFVSASPASPSGAGAGHANSGYVANLGPAAQYSRQTADYTNRKSRGMSRGAKIFIALVIVALVAGIGGLAFYIYKESQKNAINEDLHGMSQEEMQAVDNELTGMATFDEPFTVLLLGSDERTGDPDMGARTDTIVLCRVDPTQNIVSMVSIPRDTEIEIEGVGLAKFNAAYTYGGPSGTIAAVKKLCNVDIDHYAEINFEGLVGLVDAIGGIDLEVEEIIDDPDAGDVVIPAGLQHLDGEAALVFSRSRAYADGDFTRVSNQRKVIEAIIHKCLEAPATELYGLVKASTSFLTTDSAMDVDFIYSLADQIRHNNDYPLKLYTATIPAYTDSIDEISYVVADEYALAEMMEVFLAGGDVSTMGVGADAEAATEEAAGAGAASGAAGAA